MKIFSITACALLALSLQVSAQAPVALGPGALKLGKIKVEAVKTPEFSLKSGGDKKTRSGDWIEIELEFDTKAEEIDELTLEYTVQVQGEKEVKLLDGLVTHIDIPKGREHFSVMYISPRSLEKLTGGKPVNAGIVQNVWVIAKRKGQQLDQLAVKNVAIPALPHTPGVLLSKPETPFAPLYFDRYEAIKPSK